MSQHQDQLVAGVCEVLRTSTDGLKTGEIVEHLFTAGYFATKSDVNAILYNELSNIGVVSQNEDFRWSINGAQNDDSSSRSISSLEQTTTDVSRISDITLESRRAARRVLHALRSG